MAYVQLKEYRNYFLISYRDGYRKIIVAALLSFNNDQVFESINIQPLLKAYSKEGTHDVFKNNSKNYHSTWN